MAQRSRILNSSSSSSKKNNTNYSYFSQSKSKKAQSQGKAQQKKIHPQKQKQIERKYKKTSQSETRVLFDSLSEEEAQTLMNPFQARMKAMVVSDATCVNSIKNFIVALVEVFSKLMSNSSVNIVSMGRTMVSTQQWKGKTLRTYQNWLDGINQILDESGIADYPLSVAVLNQKLGEITVDSLSSSANLAEFPEQPEDKEKQCLMEGTMAIDVSVHLCRILSLSRDKTNLPNVVKVLSRYNKTDELLPIEIEATVGTISKKKKENLGYWQMGLWSTQKKALENHQNLGAAYAIEVASVYITLLKSHEAVEEYVKRVLQPNVYSYGPSEHREALKNDYLDQIDQVCKQYKSSETCPTDKCKFGSYWIFWKRCSALRKIPLLGDSAIQTLVLGTDERTSGWRIPHYEAPGTIGDSLTAGAMWAEKT